MPKIRAKLERKYDKAVKNKQVIDPEEYDPEKPWDVVFLEAAEGQETWWRKHVDKPGLLITCHVLRVSDVIDGDVQCGTSLSHTPLGSDTQVSLPGLRGTPQIQALTAPPKKQQQLARPPPGARPEPRPTKVRRLANVNDQAHQGGHAWKLNNKNEELCDGFQVGTCMKTHSDGLHCATDHTKVHQCSFCRKSGHGRHKR